MVHRIAEILVNMIRRTIVLDTWRRKFPVLVGEVLEPITKRTAKVVHPFDVASSQIDLGEVLKRRFFCLYPIVQKPTARVLQRLLDEKQQNLQIVLCRTLLPFCHDMLPSTARTWRLTSPSPIKCFPANNGNAHFLF